MLGAVADTYRERLWPGVGGWIAAVAVGAAAGVIALPLRATLAWIVGPLVAVAAVALVWWLTPVVEVAGGELRAGAAHIPLSLLGEAEPLAGDELRAALGPGLDARAHLCLRGWIRTAVRVALTDADDPTPYWVVSTRKPAALLAALAAGRAAAA